MGKSVDIKLDHGFKILECAQNMKLEFDRAGTDGIVSFVKACILSGIVDRTEICAKAVSITGNHIDETIDFLLLESEGFQWLTDCDGNLELIRGV